MKYNVTMKATVEAESAEAAKLNRSKSNGSMSIDDSRLDTATIQAAKAADSGVCRSAFRTDVDHDSEVMPISVPN